MGRLLLMPNGSYLIQINQTLVFHKPICIKCMFMRANIKKKAASAKLFIAAYINSVSFACTHLINNFGIARQQASKDINNYSVNIAPGNLVYDTRLRGYKPSKTFPPQFTSGIAEEYLQALAGNKEYGHTFQSVDLGFNNIELLRPPTPEPLPKEYH